MFRIDRHVHWSIDSHAHAIRLVKLKTSKVPMTQQLGGSANNTQFESQCNFLQGQIQAPPNPKQGIW